MKFKDLQRAVNTLNGTSGRYDDDDVVIAIAKSGMGAHPCVNVKGVHSGFDWDHGKFMIFAEEPLVVKTDKEQMYDMAWELMLYIATKPVKRETYEITAARRMFERLGYDYMQYQHLFHREIK